MFNSELSLIPLSSFHILGEVRIGEVRLGEVRLGEVRLGED
jgi:hypothetical protein